MQGAALTFCGYTDQRSDGPCSTLGSTITCKNQISAFNFWITRVATCVVYNKALCASSINKYCNDASIAPRYPNHCAFYRSICP